MKTIALIVEILTVTLLILAVVIIVKYPKDIIRGFFNLFKPESMEIGTWLYFPIWLIGKSIEGVTNFKIYDDYRADLSEKRYKTTKNLKLDFEQGTKYLRVNAESTVANEIIKSFLSFSNANIKFEDFKIEEEFPTLYQCPGNIPFYGFNILVQHACGEVKATGTYGIFKSDKLSYYCYQDPMTLHNIIGQTNKGQKFSVYTLDDLDEKIHLRINNKINVKEPGINVEATS